MSRFVELHGTGYWNDEVGHHLQRGAEKAVKSFNAAAERAVNAVEILSSYKESDVEYKSQRELIYGKRVELNV